VRLTAGTPTWAGQSREDCEVLIAKVGPTGFLIECQHATHRLADGQMFQRRWFADRMVTDWPRDGRKVRFWDLAATEDAPGKDPDRTAGCLLVEKQGQFWLVDMQVEKLSPLGIEQLIKAIAQQDGRDVEIVIEQEGGASGKTLIDHYTRI